MKYPIVIAALALLLGACGTSSPQDEGVPPDITAKCALPMPGEEFAALPAADLNLDAEAVNDALRYAAATNALSIRIYRHDCMVGAGILDPLTESIPNNVWSTTKGVTSMLTGRAIQLGLLGIDDPIGKYLPEAGAEHAAITVRQLLTQSSGLHFAWTGDLLSYAGPDSVRYTLALPFDSAPGSEFTYGQTTVSLLAKVVERAAGYDLQDFAQNELFGPLGIARDEWFWLRDRAGNTHGYAFLFIAPKHMARLGHLMLNEGAWNGERLLPTRYVREAGEPSAANPFYGYLLWSNKADAGYPVELLSEPTLVMHQLVPSAPRDMYAFVGFLDQIIFVIPSLDMVVVRTGFPGNYELNLQTVTSAHPGRWMHEFFRILMRGVKDQTIADPGPYDGYNTPAPLDLRYFVDPLSITGSLGLGPQAPEGCNLLGCEGGISYEGLLRTVEDAVCTLLGVCG